MEHEGRERTGRWALLRHHRMLVAVLALALLTGCSAVAIGHIGVQGLGELAGRIASVRIGALGHTVVHVSVDEPSQATETRPIVKPSPEPKSETAEAHPVQPPPAPVERQVAPQAAPAPQDSDTAAPEPTEPPAVMPEIPDGDMPVLNGLPDAVAQSERDDVADVLEQLLRLVP